MPMEARGIGSTEAGVTDACELPGVGALEEQQMLLTTESSPVFWIVSLFFGVVCRFIQPAYQTLHVVYYTNTFATFL